MKAMQRNIFSFANNINTVDGGTHLSGFKTGLTRVVNGYAVKNGFVKGDKESLVGDDVRGGPDRCYKHKTFQSPV